MSTISRASGPTVPNRSGRSQSHNPNTAQPVSPPASAPAHLALASALPPPTETSQSNLSADPAVTADMPAVTGPDQQQQPDSASATNQPTVVAGAEERVNDASPAVANHRIPSTQKSFHGFFGKPAEIIRVKAHADGAKRDGEPFPHSLIDGLSGLGKSALAEAIATELGAKFRMLVCSKQVDLDVISAVLHAAKEGDVTFLDEAHELNGKVQDALLTFIDRHEAPFLEDVSRNQTEDGLRSPVAHSTIVIATDRPSRLANPLKKRMGLIVHLERYSESQLRLIGRKISSNLGLPISSQALGLLARHARGVPRTLKLSLEGLRRCRGDTGLQVSKEESQRFLAQEGYDRFGLKALERSCLQLLEERGCLSAPTLATCLGVELESFSTDLEPWLIESGLVRIDNHGRHITKKGRGHIDHSALNAEETDVEDKAE